MDHLTVENIIDFVSINKINNETLSLASTVNLHIGKCDECLQKVKAFQLLYDELAELGRENYKQAVEERKLDSVK